MISQHETTSRATPATKLARLEVQAKLLPLEVDEAADITGVCRRTVLNDRRELELRSLANLSESTEAYWLQEMTKVQADIEHVRLLALGMKGSRGADLLLRAADRAIRIIEMNVVKKSICATVDARGPLYFEYLEHVARLSPENKEKVFAYADALPSTAMVIEPELLQLGDGQ
jgi:hypothetical protein